MKMKNDFKKYYLVVISFVLAIACKESYEPAAITIPRSYLVMDGFINSNRDSVTTITLSRTRNLTDSTFASDPELNARVTIQGIGGDSYNLQGRGNGFYSGTSMNINPASKYRLRIVTSSNIEYLSAYVPVQQSPAIDSVYWEQNGDVNIYANTHDPQNKTRYYRWDYLETWEHHAYYETIYGLKNNLIFLVDSTSQTFKCWSTEPSHDIVLGTSIQLSEDVINRAKVGIIAQGSVKLGVRYSMLLKQYALTEQAFDYWQILQRNTQELGTLFDAQPSQLRGNLLCISKPDEPAIGYVSVGTVSSKRIFIGNKEVTDWKLPIDAECRIGSWSQSPIDYRIWTNPDPDWAPYYFASGGGIVTAQKRCLDCQLAGGVNQKPIFW